MNCPRQNLLAGAALTRNQHIDAGSSDATCISHQGFKASHHDSLFAARCRSLEWPQSETLLSFIFGALQIANSAQQQCDGIYRRN